MSDGFNAPNTTQTPDALFAMMPAMNEAELRVTLYLVRQTFGWRREWSKPEHSTTPALARGTGLTEKGVRAGVRDGMDRGTIERANASETRSYTYRIRVAPPFAQSAEGSPQVGVTSGGGHRGLPKGSPQVGVKGSPQVGGLNSKDLTPTLTPIEHPHRVASATRRTRRAEPAASPSDAKPRKWTPFHEAVGASLGNVRVFKAGGDPLAWSANLAAQFGKAAGGDVTAAIALWGSFEAWARAAKYGSGKRWDFVTKDTAADHAGKFLSAPAVVPAPAAPNNDDWGWPT